MTSTNAPGRADGPAMTLVTIGNGWQRGLHRADCPQVRRRDLTAPVRPISEADARAYLAAAPGERRCKHCAPLPGSPR